MGRRRQCVVVVTRVGRVDLHGERQVERRGGSGRRGTEGSKGGQVVCDAGPLEVEHLRLRLRGGCGSCGAGRLRGPKFGRVGGHQTAGAGGGLGAEAGAIASARGT